MQSLHLEPGVVHFGVSYPVWPQEVAMDHCSAAAAAAALSLSELPLQWAVLWKILSGGNVQGHSLSPPRSLLYCYISCSLFPVWTFSQFLCDPFTHLLCLPVICCLHRRLFQMTAVGFKVTITQTDVNELRGACLGLFFYGIFWSIFCCIALRSCFEEYCNMVLLWSSREKVLWTTKPHMRRRWVDNDRMYHFGWTYPLTRQEHRLLTTPTVPQRTVLTSL